ncbi:complex I assembly factor TIMMDC1, mitochondrial isoform X2 [Chelonia mydas]|uniref:complex I assembly factor TIMMDC1, mitochondrial isoform X2 n=1 Tax=Chelonia mydas TaxID=8469 RepID=UPI0018A1BE43|nr:complex I assembly factor TIMMDC1, mitochondrial isoform X2 [Chelonia mydas]
MGAPESGRALGSAPRHVGTAQPPGTGWERLRELWHRDELQQYPEETLNIIKATFSGAVIGWVYGGLPAFHHAKTQYIERSQAEIFQNRLDAVQSAHRAAIRGFIRYGWRWSWRIATFVAIFNIPAGGLLLAVQKLAGETIQEKRTRERRLLHEQKLAEWKARLNVTEADLEEIVSNTQEGTMERDIEKIQELLNLPKNPLPSEDRD